MIPQGDEFAARRETAWLDQLRDRFVSVARRRVAADAVEDVVQDAMRVVVERGLRGPGSAGPDNVPALAYCFQVLRNVIGNHYQKERSRARRQDSSPPDDTLADPAPAPLESLESLQAVAIVGECIGVLRERDPACARYLARLADGLSPRELAHEERIEESALYRRVYRCRIKLRELLAKRGIEA
ncbi:MAG: RNA polymerase sigma factor [Candidatus Eiseniibacteriota bacterium]